MSLDRAATERFGDKVELYAAHRPSYPDAAIEFLSSELGFGEGSAAADVGSGTGILTDLLLTTGATVFAVEPNANMREAAERALRGRPGFVSVPGSAEETGLADSSVDLILAAQAFHWFEPRKTRAEFERILKPDGWVAAIWNLRRTRGAPFSVAYEEFLLEWGTDYEQVSRLYGRKGPLGEFFGNDSLELVSFYSEQVMDYLALEGRLLSSSYIPGPDRPGYDDMLDALKEMFSANEDGGVVTIQYDTQIFYGKLTR